MRDGHELRCLIAAGGTAGHVLPALAVADEVRARGVSVSFAGSPERVEARLVPEAGYEFDTFRVSGLPRRPGPALVRALARAVTAMGPGEFVAEHCAGLRISDDDGSTEGDER